jgi:hypothetical protein
VRTAVEDGLARRLGIGQHRRVDVDDDLVALARSAGVEAVIERGLGEQDERVSSPRPSAPASRGSELRARATRTCSRAAPTSIPTRQPSEL